MTDYISREAAIETIRKAVVYEGVADLVERAINSIPAAFEDAQIAPIPAADVRPVVRGKWETVMLNHERIGCRPTAHYCSECHQITWFRTFFCPNCVADMREES